MENFFIRLYGCFEDFFGNNMWNYLAGYSCATGGFDNACVAMHFGLGIVFFSLLFAIIYYYGVNHPKFCLWWHWLLFNIFSGLILGVIIFTILLSRLHNGMIDSCLVYILDSSGNSAGQAIGQGECFGVALASSIMWIILFFIWSIIVKWGSVNCKKTPF